MTVEPLRDVRNHFSEVVDRVEHQHERVTVTRNGRPVAVSISPQDHEPLEQTLSDLTDPDQIAGIGIKMTIVNGNIVYNAESA